jgi:hypothetical protein
MALNEELQRSLDRLVGTWRTEGRMIDSGERWAGHDTYQWFPGDQILVHRVDVTMFGERIESIEFFVARDGEALTFDQTSYASDGTVERAVGSFDADGRYHNDLTDVRATVTWTDADTMRALWERKSEGAWAEWMDVGFTRVGEPDIVIRSRTADPAG